MYVYKITDTDRGWIRLLILIFHILCYEWGTASYFTESLNVLGIFFIFKWFSEHIITNAFYSCPVQQLVIYATDLELGLFVALDVRIVLHATYFVIR